MNKSLLAIIILLVVTVAFWAITFWRSHPVDTSTLENIHGIPFPTYANQSLITEKLAHADLYLRHSRLARRLDLTVSFTPTAITGLSVGIRDNPFWLSYNKINLCCTAAELADPSAVLTKTVTIPVTDKIADRDGSLDLMFFATNPNSLAVEDAGVHDRTVWQLHDLSVRDEPALPNRSSLRDFIQSFITRAKPL